MALKKICMLFAFVLGMVIVPKTMFAGGSSELTIINKTGNTVEQVIITQSDKHVENQQVIIRDGDRITFKLPKDVSYDIVLWDEKEHKYGREGYYLNDDAKIEITSKDFISQGWWDTIKQAAGF